MPQAENVISFPVDAGTTEFLNEFIGSDGERLDAVVQRLSGLEALMFFLKNSDQLSPLAASAFGGLELILHDCLAIAEMRPVRKPA